MNQSSSELVSVQEKRISELVAQLHERDREIDTLNARIVELHDEYKLSNSWRFTAPLRLIRTIGASCYLRVYRRGGLVLRNLFPDRVVNQIKKRVPAPHRIPKHLANQLMPNSVTTQKISDVDASTDKPDIFIFSIIDWDFRTQRPQHIARLLAENHRVFYVEMMLNLNGPSVRRVDDRLFVIRLDMHSIGHIQPYEGKADNVQLRGWINSFINFADQVGATSFKHIIIQHPFWWQMAQHLPSEFHIIFDCMDDIAGFSNTTEWMLEQEHAMISGCDKLVVSSEYLKKKFGAIKQPQLIRNGGDLTHFQPDESIAEPPAFLRDRGFSKQSDRIDVGYVGAIAEWFDTSLVRSVANLNPDMHFHLCGAVTTQEAARLESLSNVTLYGEIPYSDVPAFIGQMDVMTIPFQLLPIIQACDPVKFYEYSAMGKPTVATCLPELKRAENLLFLSTGPQEFSSNLRKAVGKGKKTEFCEDLRVYAAANTWRHRSELFEQVLEDLPKVSVVILSFGDPLWTINTLRSLFDMGATYPNLEVLLVDNGSSEDHLAQIRDAIESTAICPVRLIENGENLGFSRGNNVGIKHATGEYILLLNNDTYLAPGAIAAMVKHLNNNPSIGVVCPMTNNIGNEARIDIQYADMGEMIRNSRQLTIGYRGQHSEIPVVAYFAAMLRRNDFEQFGLLSEDYGLGMFEDDDHCAVIRSKGYICALAEDAFTHHHLSATFDTINAERKRKLFEANKKIYEAKFGEWIPHKYRTKRPRSRLS